MSGSEMSPASKTSDVHRLVRRNNSDKKKEWLGNLVAGDDVMVILPTRVEYAKVKKATGTQIFVLRKKRDGTEFVAKYSRKRGVRTMPMARQEDDRILPPNTSLSGDSPLEATVIRQ